MLVTACEVHTWQVHRAFKGIVGGRIWTQLVEGAVASQKNVERWVEGYELTVRELADIVVARCFGAGERLTDSSREVSWQDEDRLGTDRTKTTKI